MKRTILAAFVVLAIAATPAIAAAASITLDQAFVSPGSQVSFTVTGNRAAFVYNVCREGSVEEGVYVSEIKPVIDGSAGPFTVPAQETSCHASLLDKDQEPVIGQRGVVVNVLYCVSAYPCAVYD
jgi:hypothetical protein